MPTSIFKKQEEKNDYYVGGYQQSTNQYSYDTYQKNESKTDGAKNVAKSTGKFLKGAGSNMFSKTKNFFKKD